MSDGRKITYNDALTLVDAGFPNLSALSAIQHWPAGLFRAWTADFTFTTTFARFFNGHGRNENGGLPVMKVGRWVKRKMHSCAVIQSK